MPTQPYYVDGKRVPGTTTIINSFKESGGLIHWSWKMPFDGLTECRALLEDSLNGAFRLADAQAFLQRPLSDFDYKVKRQSAADAGTIAHEIIDCRVHGRHFDASKYDPKLIEIARPAVEAFENWAEGHRFEVCETERPLVSRKYLFGGTRDAIFINGKRALGDWKTSKRLYPDHLIQLAAYGILDEENGGTIDGGFHLLMFTKQEKPTDPVSFHHHYWSQLDTGKEAFLLMRRLYDCMKDLERHAK